MNWISGLAIGLCLALCGGCGAPASGDDSANLRYAVHYEVRIDPDDAAAIVVMTVRQSRHLLREVSFAYDDRFELLEGDASRSDDGQLTWTPADGRSELRWRVSVPHRRSDSGFDAWLESDWGMFRAEDIIPRARTRSLKGSAGDTTLSFSLPPTWSVVTEYNPRQNPMQVTRPGRRFSQPTGWIAVGKLGVRRETIAGTRVAVAGPLGHDVRRMDMLALLNWTLPELANLLGETPERLTIVSAAEPMWRGGLSAPASLYIHADRPMISENATSTLLHETMHVALGIDAADGQDWIVEGLAEYYSLELLHRGGAITSRRYKRALEDQAEWAEDARTLCGRASTGARTAYAVTVLRQLDTEIRKATSGRSSLDNVVARLGDDHSPASIASLAAISRELIDRPPAALEMDNLPGCRTIASLWTDNTTSN